MTATNLSNGRRRISTAHNLSQHPVPALPTGVAPPEPLRIVAIRLPRPTLVNGRPV